MKLEDLRLGNWVKIDVGVGQVSCLMTVEFEDYSLGEGMPIIVDVEGYACPRSCTMEEVEGIELTDKILLGCGFEEILCDIIGCKRYGFDSTLFEGETIMNLYDGGLGYIIHPKTSPVRIKYVHELQNTFYAINRTELEVKL